MTIENTFKYQRRKDASGNGRPRVHLTCHSSTVMCPPADCSTPAEDRPSDATFGDRPVTRGGVRSRLRCGDIFRRPNIL